MFVLNKKIALTNRTKTLCDLSEAFILQTPYIALIYNPKPILANIIQKALNC